MGRVTVTDDTGFADCLNTIPEYVASRTRQEPLDWNASLITGDSLPGYRPAV
jgi:hypothetical protein